MLAGAFGVQAGSVRAARSRTGVAGHAFAGDGPGNLADTAVTGPSWEGEVVSYDLDVFGQRALTREDLIALLKAAGLDVDEAESQGDSLTVVRGAKHRYSFTLGLPVRLEPEDVPEEVTAVMLGPRVLYDLIVEGSSATETPHAVRFARRLAQEVDGAVLDQQADDVWTRGKLRAVAPVPPGRVDTVDVRWYAYPDVAGRDVANSWLDLARRFLPEALPRRFGSYEPLPMKLDVDGPQAFVEAVQGEDMTLFFKASRPCLEGHLAGGARPPGVNGHSLTLLHAPLHDPRWQQALRRFLTAFAAATGTFFASAEVVRGLDWSGQGIAYGPGAERTTYLAPRGRWAGLLPYPAWWTWFGPDYVPLVRPHLPPEQLHELDGGLFHARGDDPAPRAQLADAPPARVEKSSRSRGLWTREDRSERSPKAQPWLPSELLAAPTTTNPAVYNPPLTPADTVPSRLAEWR